MRQCTIKCPISLDTICNYSPFLDHKILQKLLSLQIKYSTFHEKCGLLQKYNIFANSVDPDEMLHIAASHLGLHCLQSSFLVTP